MISLFMAIVPRACLRKFFPSDNLTISLLSMLAVFGPSFIARPLGGLFFGHIGSVRL